MHTKEKAIWFWELLQESYKTLKRNDPLRLSSSTAFFATFSIIPIIVILLDFASTIFDIELLKEEIFKILQKVFGEEPTSFLAHILANVRNMQQGSIVTVGLVIFLMFIATTLFDVIHSSFNQILQVRIKKETDFTFTLKNRGLFLLIIFVGGFLFMGTFLMDILAGSLGNLIPALAHMNILVIKILDVSFSAALFCVWLAIIYKYLPDFKLPWKPVWFGSFITVILFLIGQFILGKIIFSENLDNIYGSSASLVLLLLFIFYSSFILYFGFCLVKEYAEKNNYDIEPTKYAIRYEINEIE